MTLLPGRCPRFFPAIGRSWHYRDRNRAPFAARQDNGEPRADDKGFVPTQDRYAGSVSGTFAASSSSHTAALASEGARQSLRGDSEPPEEIFGPLGSAERLN
jgi:hypothetical protein